MPLDPHAQAFVDLLLSLEPEDPADKPSTPEERRESYEALAVGTAPGPDVGSVTNDQIDGPNGAIPVRVFHPIGGRPTSLIVYYHGGGWCIGSLDTHEEVCRGICNSADSVVVSVDYRLAPENRFPSAVDDALMALDWAAEHGERLAGAQVPILVAGDSAGGTLATVAALSSRDGAGPQIAGQILIYPATDLRMLDSPSLTENGSGYVLTLETMLWFRDNYLNSLSDADDWRASPLLAESHANLPPALVITAEYDPLRDEGRAYADKLRASGVDVTHSEYAGMVHVFIQLPEILPAGAQAISEIGDWTKGIASV